MNKTPTGYDIYPHQDVGIDFLAATKVNSGGILADDMGLGKSIQSIMAYHKLGQGASLVVSTNTAKDNWKDEFTKWLGDEWDDGVRVFVVQGTGPEQRRTIMECLDWYKKESADGVVPFVLIMHYESFRTNWAMLCLSWMYWHCIIFDEAHRLKNTKAKVTKAAMAFCVRQKHARKWFLTGTPVVNHAGDLWPLLHMIDNSTLAQKAWIRKWLITEEVQIFAGPGRTPIHVTKIGPPKDPVAFQEYLRPYLLRRMKREVLETLPARLPAIYVPVKLESAQRAIYDQMEESMYSVIEGSEKGREREVFASNTVAQIVRLKQIAVSPDLMIKDAETLRGAKVDALEELLEMAVASEQKFAVFSQFKTAIQRLQPLFHKWGYNVATFTGDTDVAGRTIARKSLATDEVQGIAMTMQAGGESINLTDASIVIFMDYLWTPKDHEQPIGRVDRIGQRNIISVYYLYAVDTIESWLRTVIGDKQDTFDLSVPDVHGKMFEAVMQRKLR